MIATLTTKCATAFIFVTAFALCRLIMISLPPEFTPPPVGHDARTDSREWKDSLGRTWREEILVINDHPRERKVWRERSLAVWCVENNNLKWDCQTFEEDLARETAAGY